MLHDDLIVFSPKKYYFVYIEMAILGGDPLFLDRDKARPAWSARNWGKRSPGWSRWRKMSAHSDSEKPGDGRAGSAAYCGKWAMAAIHPW